MRSSAIIKDCGQWTGIRKEHMQKPKPIDFILFFNKIACLSFLCFKWLPLNLPSCMTYVNIPMILHEDFKDLGKI